MKKLEVRAKMKKKKKIKMAWLGKGESVIR
jgi:hypothetical protein